MNIFRKPSEKLSIQKCLLRDMYKLASMGVNMSKEVPIALKRYHRSVVSGTIIALRAVPPVSL